MNIDPDKLKRLKALHLSYLTDADRDAAVVVEEGFELNGILIEAIPDMEALLAPNEEDFPSKAGETFKNTSPVKSLVKTEVQVEPKKKAGRKKKA